MFGGRCHLLRHNTNQGASAWARRRQPRDKAEATRKAGASNNETIAQSINSEGSHWSGSNPRVSSMRRLKFRRASSAASKSSPVTAASLTSAESSVGWHMFLSWSGRVSVVIFRGRKQRFCDSLFTRSLANLLACRGYGSLEQSDSGPPMSRGTTRVLVVSAYVWAAHRARNQALMKIGAQV